MTSRVATIIAQTNFYTICAQKHLSMISVGDTKQQHPETRQDKQRNFSHSSRRPESNLENGSLETVQGLPSSQIYPHNKSGTSSGCVENRNINSIFFLAGSYSPKKYNTPDRPSCTPSKSRTILETDASVKQVVESSSSLPSGYVDRQRGAIIKSLGNGVSRGSLEYFKKILPPIRPEFDINKISSHLIKNGNLVQEKGIYVWKEFRMETTPTTTEKQFFNDPLVNVFNSVCDAALGTSNIKVASTVDMAMDGDNGPWSVNGSSAKPDGYFKLKGTEEKVKRKRKRRREEKRKDDGEKEENGEKKDLWYNIAVSLSLKTVDDSEVKSKSYLNFSSKINSFAFTECSECCS